MKYILTCDIGGTDLKFGILDSNYTFHESGSIPTKAKEGGQAIITQIIDIFNNYKNKYLIAGIALSSAGIINPLTTEVLDATNAISNYIGLNIRAEIQKQLNIPISVENDVNCMALCESTIGVGANSKNMVAMTIGTGIGGAIIIEGTILHGNGFSAGEWGNMLINNMPYEKQAATKALVEQAKKVYPDIKNGIDVFSYYDNFDPKITKIVNNFFELLSQGIVNIIYSLNPEKLVIGGGITARGDKFLNELIPYIESKLSKYIYSKTKILIAKHKNNAGMLGAYINFLKHYS